MDENGKPKREEFCNEDASVSVYHMKDEEARNAFIGAKAGSEVIFNPAKAYPNKTGLLPMLGVKQGGGRES